MIKVRLNEEIIEVEKNESLQELLNNNELNAKYFAVAVNQQFVAKSCYAETKLVEGDVIDIISPMQGG